LDITEHKQTEQQLQQNLQRANRLITALDQVAARLQTRLNADQVFETLGAGLKQLELTCIIVLSQTDMDFRVQYHSIEPKVLKHAEKVAGLALSDIHINKQFPIASQLINNHKLLFVPDVTRLAESFLPTIPKSVVSHAASKVGLLTGIPIMLIPMLVEQQLIGILGVWGKDLQEDDIPAFSIFASQTAAALQVTQLHDQIRREHVEEQATLLRFSQALLGENNPDAIINLTLLEAAQSLKVDHAALALVDEDHRHYAAYVWTKPSAEIREQVQRVPIDSRTAMGQVILTQAPLALSDITVESYGGQANLAQMGIVARMIVPMIVFGESLGCLAVNKQNVYDWSEDEMRLLSLIATNAALALERARLYQAEQHRRTEAETLHQITSALTSTLELDQVLETILSQLSRVIPYDSATLFLLEGQSLRALTGRGLPNPEQVIGQVFSPETLFFKEILLTGRPVILVDAQANSSFQKWGNSDYIRGWMGIPLVVRGEIIGILTADSRKMGAYSEVEANLMQTFAYQAALAIHNARIYEEVLKGQERLRSLSQQLVNVQETERRYLARELHDQVGQVLTAIKISLQTLKHLSKDTSLTPYLENSLTTTERALETVRNLSLDLRPSVLDDLGLVPALRWYLNRQLQVFPLNVDFNAQDFETRFPSQVETACFRLVQEALTNIIRHAEAQHVQLDLHKKGMELVLRIQDNGVGFDVPGALARATSGSSLGLLSMQERVELAGGRLEIVSKPGKGTKLIAHFPLAVQDNQPEERRL